MNPTYESSVATDGSSVTTDESSVEIDESFVGFMFMVPEITPERSNFICREFAMANGASPFSYRTNSAYQRRVVRATKQLMHAVVMEKLDIEFLNIENGIFQITDMVPSEIEDKQSFAWNKGKAYYSHGKEEVIKEYTRHYEEDMDSFLNYRAQEVAPGGLVFITVPARPDGTPHSKVIYNMLADILGSCFLDLAKKHEVDSFNIPVYITSPSEVEEEIRRNGSFSIEKLEILLSN
ncbi:putative 3-ketoacyl-CoA synthase 3-like [Capsicum annuum]|nr:putative 3-ketoacyl-CoA synthase 3-like [Capsicum annuum]